ncbi:hypothetical protein CDAR_398121 [Caerostris darwini]|uniref:Uncharacterized protein n=1 Tax=Caerostris darwini TaxID=1538125 RepID=A0AAV4WQT6_9ARAC|nr:hypothetical protein CDAR_398121 [Caerostris darwini]
MIEEKDSIPVCGVCCSRPSGTYDSGQCSLDLYRVPGQYGLADFVSLNFLNLYSFGTFLSGTVCCPKFVCFSTQDFRADFGDWRTIECHNECGFNIVGDDSKTHFAFPPPKQ